MSRYVRIELERVTLEELREALVGLGLSPKQAPRGDRLMPRESFECSGDPVDLLLPAGTWGAVADFGFRCDTSGPPLLVCSEVDTTLLETTLRPRLQAELTTRRAVRVAEAEGYAVTTHVDAEGTRLVLRRRSSP